MTHPRIRAILGPRSPSRSLVRSPGARLLVARQAAAILRAATRRGC